MPPRLQSSTSKLLAGIDCPADVRDLAPDVLPRLAREVRDFVVDQVCAAGGHLGPNLGVVELTLALHRVFESPRDALIFDTGHQAYVHKLLTGRREAFCRLRQADGLSGYPSRVESVHDVVENSHASTALSYADGLAKAYQLADQVERSVVAIVGDGSLTGGMAWEALNNLGAAPERPVIVVVNDNGRSYAPTAGALAAQLSRLKSGGGAEIRPNLFTDLGFTYLGPVDGHNVVEVEAVLRRARRLRRPVVVHVVTVKGKGYGPAEQDVADCLHAVGAVDPATGRPACPAFGAAVGTTSVVPVPSWTDVFSKALVRLAEQREDLVAVTAAMLRPTGLYAMQQRFPGRVFDVGIAEQHAVTSAAGLAMGGLHPVVAIYATFLNRAFDQVLMDVALHRLPVTFVLDRAGITGPDGPSHHGMWDVSVFAAVPGLRIAAPRDAARVGELLNEATAWRSGPTMLRFPKGAVVAELPSLERTGGVDIVHCSNAGNGDVLLVAAGPLVAQAIEAARELEKHGIATTVVDPRWVLPVQGTVVHMAARHRLVVTVEDGLRDGGMGTAVLQACQEQGITPVLVRLGLPGEFLGQGSRDWCLEQVGLSAKAIVSAVLVACSASSLGADAPVSGTTGMGWPRRAGSTPAAVRRAT